MVATVTSRSHLPVALDRHVPDTLSLSQGSGMVHPERCTGRPGCKGGHRWSETAVFVYPDGNEVGLLGPW